MRTVLLMLCSIMWLPAFGVAQEPGDSVRLRVPTDEAWRYGRVFTTNESEIVLQQPEGLEAFNRRTVDQLERWDPRRPQWVVGTWALGGLAVGALAAALASDDATTEDVVLSIVAGGGVGVAAGFLDVKFRPGSWTEVPPP